MRARTDTQTRVTTIHIASSTTHAKCNNCRQFVELQSRNRFQSHSLKCFVTEVCVRVYRTIMHLQLSRYFLFHRAYSIIGTRSGFAVNLGSKADRITLGVSNVSRIHFGFKFVVNPDPDPIIEYAHSLQIYHLSDDRSLPLGLHGHCAGKHWRRQLWGTAARAPPPLTSNN